MPATLHAFDNIHILGKDGAPHLGIGGPHLGKFIAADRLVGIIDLDLFMGSAGAIGTQENGKGMVVMDAKKYIREKGDIFSAGIPL